MSMRVCMIAGHKMACSGLENVVLELSSFLAKFDAKITIFNLYDKECSKTSQEFRNEMVRPYNILPPRLRFGLYDHYSYSLRVWRKIKHSNLFDIIHGHGGFCFFPALFRDRTPLVMTFHGLRKGARFRLYGPNSRFLKNPRYFTLFYSEEIAAKKCDVAVVPSKSVKEELISLYKVNPMKIKVIYNGVNTANFRPFDKNLARKILGLPKNKKYVIWVGNNAKLKGLQKAIRAVKGLKNVYLLVVGVSGNNFGNVVFWGEVKERQVLCTLYNASNILIFPTLYEGFPLVPLEAMACGLPIIISQECPTKEIIVDGVEGFIVKNEPKYYTEKIVAILDNDVLRREMSLKCIKLAQKFSWENQGKEYLKVYERLI